MLLLSSSDDESRLIESEDNVGFLLQQSNGFLGDVGVFACCSSGAPSKVRGAGNGDRRSIAFVGYIRRTSFVSSLIEREVSNA
jgi:hypothetical protein